MRAIKRLKSNRVKLKMENNKIIIEPIEEFGGIFQEYALKDKSIEEIIRLEQEAIENARAEKFNSNRR